MYRKVIYTKRGAFLPLTVALVATHKHQYLDKLAHRQRHFGHQYALLTEGAFECLSDGGHTVAVIGDKGQDRNLLLLTFPESHAFGDSETIKTGADFLTNEGLHHRLADRARVGDVAP